MTRHDPPLPCEVCLAVVERTARTLEAPIPPRTMFVFSRAVLMFLFCSVPTVRQSQRRKLQHIRDEHDPAKAANRCRSLLKLTTSKSGTTIFSHEDW